MRFWLLQVAKTHQSLAIEDLQTPYQASCSELAKQGFAALLAGNQSYMTEGCAAVYAGPGAAIEPRGFTDRAVLTHHQPRADGAKLQGSRREAVGEAARAAADAHSGSCR